MHSSAAEHDARRTQSVLAERSTRSQQFFSTSAGQWDRMRLELFGRRADVALLGLLDESWTVADLGCGTGAVTAAPPVGTVASAVLVGLADKGVLSSSAAPPTKRSCIGFAFKASAAPLSWGSTSATASVVTRLVSRNSDGDSSCSSSHGGTLSASDSRSRLPPFQK